MTAIDVAVLLIALSVFMVATSFSLYWFARATSAMCSAALNIKQVQAFDPTAGEEVEVQSQNAAPAPSAVSPTEGALNTRTRLSGMTDAALREAVQDVKVVTMDENAGIDDAEAIPGGGRGVYAHSGR